MLIFKRGCLFQAPTHLAHCISSDMVMSKGIAREFRDRFGHIPELRNQKAEVGQIAILNCNGRKIFYLVTKSKYYEKPTPWSIHASLLQLKRYMVDHCLTQIAMPKIACGLDKMAWEDVESILRRVFHDQDILVTIYTL